MLESGICGLRDNAKGEVQVMCHKDGGGWGQEQVCTFHECMLEDNKCTYWERD